jgi:hypothetical protein
MKTIAIALTVILTSLVVSSGGSLKADEPPTQVPSTVVENIDEEAGMFVTVIDESTIEISLPG